MKKYFIGKGNKQIILKRVLNITFIIAISFLIMFVIVGIVRIYLFDWYTVPSASMSPTLNVGDKIIVDKRIIGARIYRSFNFSKGEPLDSYRTKGRRSIEVSDIVIFNFPLDSACQKIEFKINYVYVKRCVAVPGDTVSIVNGFIKNNHYTGKIGLPIEQRKLSFMDSLYLLRHKAYPRLLENTQFVRWTIKDFGPLLIPKAGTSVELTPQNIGLYKLYIEYETSSKIITTTNGVVMLDGEVIKDYIFTKNYYFMCGDNFTSSYDSRNWGLVPENFIIGIVGEIIRK